ncbi:alpha/beta fold hydrolase [Inquilinus limosus]|uniref:Alpha/beta hydrolase n=1 Tax=Inquilinus limosus MP06 TaxID=1398085 RepID=A0A0A0D641_9PROT|nr:alpha/beta hydrolase [Inquilinus limosus]KGM32497.1 alpha/beta hydrolase [Inquilinus limosus MP06]
MTRTVSSVDTELLRIAYEDSGPRDGPPLVLLHGWPDHLRSWDRVLPMLHEAGFRTLVPNLRGFGGTAFRDPGIMRSGQLSALGQDLLDFAGALGLGRFAVVGHDWGARAAYIASALAPDRVSHSVAMSVGWGTNAPDQELSLIQVQNYWYHWYMALDRGADLVRGDRRGFTRHIWRIWTPGWELSDAEFEETATAFDNPDWAEVVLHSYRVRWGLAPRDPRYDALEARLAGSPEIGVPTLVLHGGSDPCNDPSTSAGKERFFRGRYERDVLPGIGHFPQREAPNAVAEAILQFLAAEG